jgi:DTW domain-containing protein YfiP
MKDSKALKAAHILAKYCKHKHCEDCLFHKGHGYCNICHFHISPRMWDLTAEDEVIKKTITGGVE